jgi:hypothetical protein
METSTSVAQTRTGLAISIAEMQRLPSVRQKSGYFAVIAIILIVAVALCWGLTHI